MGISFIGGGDYSTVLLLKHEVCAWSEGLEFGVPSAMQRHFLQEFGASGVRVCKRLYV